MRIKVFVAAAVAACAGCKSPVYDADVQFVERVVVSGVLTPGKPVSGIYIGRTLPVTTIPDPGAAQIHDAIATVVVDGIGYPLHDAGNALYGNPGLVAVSGKTYELDVDWHGLRARAHTQVPFIPDTSFVAFSRPATTYISNEYPYFLDVAITARVGETYGAAWSHPFTYTFNNGDSVIHGEYIETNNDNVLKRGIDAQSDGKLHIEISGYLTDPGTSSTYDTVYVTFAAFDDQYYDYFNSTGSPTSFEDLVLGISPGAIKWNVSGDGIGMFIGKATILDPIILHWTYPGTNLKSRITNRRK